MDGNQITDPWYAEIGERMGFDAAVEAGYFEETHPWTESYEIALGREALLAPAGTSTILQFSGAFWPFHEGHLQTLQTALIFLNRPSLVVLHVDHLEYRETKGHYDAHRFKEAFKNLRQLSSNHQVETRLVFEDDMPRGCSRNFTRLYAELCGINPGSTVWFLAGGDRASFCLAFRDKGHCIVAGRDQSANYRHYASLQNERLVFLPGHHSQSSRQIRALETRSSSVRGSR